MELDPKLAAVAAAAIAPTKIFVDAMMISLDIPSRFRLVIAFLVALTIVSILQGYNTDTSLIPMGKLVAGNLMAGFTAWSGAVLATELHKNAEQKKTERRQADDEDERTQSSSIG